MPRTKQEYAIELMESILENGVFTTIALTRIDAIFDVHPMRTAEEVKRIMLKAKARGIVEHDRYLTGKK